MQPIKQDRCGNLVRDGAAICFDKPWGTPHMKRSRRARLIDLTIRKQRALKESTFALKESTFELPSDLVLEVLESLRLAHIYALKEIYPEELPADFKPWKWDGSEIEFAQRASDCYRRLVDACTRSSACLG